MPDELDEIRDEIAAKLGWHFVEANRHFASSWTKGNGESRRFDHPVPASLDWVAANWPKDRVVMFDRGMSSTDWHTLAVIGGKAVASGPHPSLLDAWFRLLLAVLEAEGKTP